MRLDRLLWIGIFGCAGAVWSPEPAPGQQPQTGTITGAVRQEGMQRPLAGVQVSISALGIGTLTNAQGRYILGNVPPGEHTVQVQSIGFTTEARTVAMAPGETVQLDVELAQRAVELDAIIVTGTAGEQRVRSLGNTVARVDATGLQRSAPQPRMETMLAGHVAGLTIADGSGAVGGGSNMRIRGAGSIVLSSEPLIYVDGVRMFAGAGNDVTLGTGNSRPASRLNDISPEMIESIEVIKGPAAATLYGTEASNGVINIITKRGAEGTPQFVLTSKVGQNWYRDPKKHWPGSYFTCTGAGTHGCAPGEIVYVNVFMEDWIHHGLEHFRVGTPVGFTGSVSGGAQSLRYYFNLGWERDEAPVPTNHEQRLTARANLNWLPRPDLTINFGLSAIRSELESSTTNQPAHITGFHWSCPGAGCERGTGTPNALDGPFRGYIAYLPDKYVSHLKGGQNVNRNTFSFNATHNPFAWLTHRLILGVDHTETQGFRTVRHLEGAVGVTPRMGARNVQYRTTQYFSLDYSGTATFTPTPSLSLGTSSGIQYYDRTSEFLSGTGTDFAVPTLTSISAGEQQSTVDGFLQNKTIGAYFQEQVSWQDRIFLTGAIRGDDNSAFGQDFEFVVYPKLSLSWVASDEPFLRDRRWLNSLRFRGAWGQAGQQPDEFAAVRLYSPALGYQGVGGVTPETIGNPEVEPEVGDEIELGFDAGLVDDRLSVELTYYAQRRKNALIAVPVKPSVGFPGTQLRNIGEIRNTGWELGLQWDAYRGRNVGLHLGTSVHLNSNEVTDLGGISMIPVFGQNASTGWPGQRHIEGFPLGSIFLPRVVSAEIVGEGQNARAINVMCESGPAIPGHPNLTRGGGPPVPCDAENAPEVYWGASVPTREISFTGQVSLFRDIELFAHFDYVGGYHMVDGITAAAHTFFRNTKAIHERTDPILLGYEALGAVGSNQPGLFDASMVMLRNVSASYAIPERWAGSIGAQQMTLTLSGHNLWRPWRAQKDGFGQPIVDPEIRTTGGGGGDPGGIAAYTQDGFPLFKRFLATLRVTF